MRITKYLLIIIITTLSTHYGCTTTPDYVIDNSTALNCADGFIKCLYRGAFEPARVVTLPNTANEACLKKYIFQYNQFITKEKKQQYKNASAVYNDTEYINDSTVILHYKDPIMNQNQPPLKVIKQGNAWLVDFAYYCSGNV